MKSKAAFVLILLTLCSRAMADASNSQSSATGGSGYAYSYGYGGMGGTASSISNGGLGGAGGSGGNGFGGMGGTGIGGAGGLGMGGSGGNGTGGSANNSGNAQSFNIEQVRQSPAVFMSAPMPTSPCQASLGGFLSFIGGIGLAGSRTLEECELRELSRTAYGIGQPAMAMHVLCEAKHARDFEGCAKNNENLE